jgi:hypothetical protein
VPEPPELILLALTPFSRGDIGWLTERGVIREETDRPQPGGVMRVKALEGIRPFEHGRFQEVGSSER